MPQRICQGKKRKHGDDVTDSSEFIFLRGRTFKDYEYLRSPFEHERFKKI